MRIIHSKTQSRPANGLQLSMLVFCAAGALLVSSVAAAGPACRAPRLNIRKTARRA